MDLGPAKLAFCHFSCFNLCSAVEVSVSGAGSSSLNAKSRSIRPSKISMSCLHLLKFPPLRGSIDERLSADDVAEAAK
ncbi:hypothetical protein EV1_022466 [Malus domestica]